MTGDTGNRAVNKEGVVSSASKGHFQRGDRLFESARYEAAADEYEEGLRLQPDADDARYRLARVYRAVGLIERALGLLADFLTRHPSDEAALLLQGTLLLSTQAIPRRISLWPT